MSATCIIPIDFIKQLKKPTTLDGSKMIYIHFNKHLVPNVKLKWDSDLEGNIDCGKVSDICNTPLPDKIKQFRWKSVHDRITFLMENVICAKQNMKIEFICF